MNQHAVKKLSLLTDQECALQIGQRFCKARQSLGMTTHALAQFLGTSEVKISEVEQGKFFIPIPWGVTLYQSLGINLIWLLTGDRKNIKKTILNIDELFYYMQVPEVEECVFTELNKAKTLLKDQIREYERIHEVSLSGGVQ